MKIGSGLKKQIRSLPVIGQETYHRIVTNLRPTISQTKWAQNKYYYKLQEKNFSNHIPEYQTSEGNLSIQMEESTKKKTGL